MPASSLSAHPPLPGFAGQGIACRRGERLVFAKLDFALAAGGALILTGPNGSGKSSLLRLMAGLGRPEAGALTWEGEPIAADPAAHRARLHFIGHQEAVKPVLSVAENLGFWAGLHGAIPDLGAALARFRLERLADWPARLLSAGQRRRLALARLVASPAALWLLDEPATGLDDEAVGDLRAAIAAHREAGGRVALSTHTALALPEAATLTLGRAA